MNFLQFSVKITHLLLAIPLQKLSQLFGSTFYGALDNLHNDAQHVKLKCDTQHNNT